MTLALRNRGRVAVLASLRDNVAETLRDEARFRAIRREVLDFALRLNAGRVSFVPISALHGDMVVVRRQPVAASEIPARLDLDPAEVARHLHQLTERGLIKFEPDQTLVAVV